MTHVTCRLTAKNRDQLRNPIRSVIEYEQPLPFYSGTCPVVDILNVIRKGRCGVLRGVCVPRKLSSGDLHSRLKTRKLLGVGETPDGDVHRSKVLYVAQRSIHRVVNSLLTPISHPQGSLPSRERLRD